MHKTISLSLFSILILFSNCNNTTKQEDISSIIERGLTRATEQGLLMAKTLENQEGRLPTTTNPDGTLGTSDYHWWCCGFFPGQLWYTYENNPTPELKKYAEMYTERVEDVKNITYSHDVGFMLYCSYGNGYRLTKNPEYKEVMITGANSLSTRYDERTGLIRSWDFNKHIWQYPVIIDNMMNLEFMLWASKATDNPKYRDIAISHADKTQKHHFRPDYSCYHVVSYDTITGNPHIKQTHQGHADESTWARGQAWALYGYAMMARETGNKAYLQQANNIATFIMNHPNMPEDKVPYWDLDAPDIPQAPRDASAAAIIASSLLDLSIVDKTNEANQYLAYAEDQIRSLTSPDYLAEIGTNNNFILMHSTGHFPNNSEVDVPLSYADYYYIEALLKLKKIKQL